MDFWFENQFKVINIFKFFIYMFLIHIISTHVIVYVIEMNKLDRLLDVKYFDDLNLLSSFFIASFFGPLIETLLFQLVIYKIIMFFSFKNYNYIIFIVSSSILFGLSHSYNLLTIISGIYSGLILALIFIGFSIKTKYAFFITLLFHSCYNIYAFIINHNFLKLLFFKN